MLHTLVVDFDGFLNPMPHGWFDIGAHDDSQVKDVVKFLVNATEYFEVHVFGPRSLMFGGIQLMQAAIIYWTQMEVNKATMHDLMRVLVFPKTMPEDYAAHINGSGVIWGTAQVGMVPEAIDFILEWQQHLAYISGRKE